MFFELAKYLYASACTEQPTATVPSEYVNIAKQVFKKIGWKTKVTGRDIDETVEPIPENNKIMVGLSGGLDSVYLMHKLKDEGYDVTAFHVAGLNRNSANYETEAATAAAKQAHVPIIFISFKSPKQAFPDNPYKNQLILSIALDKGIKRGIYRYAVGSDWTTPLSEAVVGFTITDSVEVYREYWNGVKQRFPQAELIFIPDNEKKITRLKYLFERGALENVSSCISPFRFRASLHATNESKYNIRLMPGRCGSCYKCSMEYILLVEEGLISKNEAYYRHCWDILADSKIAHRPDLFAKNLPFEKRLENLKNYGS